MVFTMQWISERSGSKERLSKHIELNGLYPKKARSVLDMGFSTNESGCREAKQKICFIQWTLLKKYGIITNWISKLSIWNLDALSAIILFSGLEEIILSVDSSSGQLHYLASRGG